MAASGCVRRLATAPSLMFNASAPYSSALTIHSASCSRCNVALKNGAVFTQNGEPQRGNLDLRINAVNIGDFGARDPFPEEIESNFGEKVLGNAGTEPLILIPSSKLGLSERSCKPVATGTKPLSEDEAKAMLRKVVGWRLSNSEHGLKIFCEWNMKDFGSGVTLLDRIAVVAIAEEHYPELHLIPGNKVRAELFNESMGGLSENDFILAAKIDKIQTLDLVKKARCLASDQNVPLVKASFCSGADQLTSQNCASSPKELGRFLCKKESQRVNGRVGRTNIVRAEVSEGTQKFRPRSIREEKEDPLISTECISKTVTNVSLRDIRGGVVALGKFDALHIGHRALAEQAARMGSPVLLSFAGMGEVLGWSPRLPVAALSDRKRIMAIWAKRCGGVVPQEYALDFTKVRSLSPKEFVKKLATELQVTGVVAGANYRFGYKAAGDASDLVHLCNEYGLQAFIVDPVMDTSEVDVKKDEMSGSSREKGQVSSTRVRKALAKGDLERVASLLGRKHRLMLSLENARHEEDALIVPLKNALNQGPREGCYDCTVITTNEPLDSVSTTGHLDVGDEFLGVGQVKIGPEDIELCLRDNNVEQLLQRTLIGLEFPYG